MNAILVPFIITTSFSAGLNVYATVATLGLLARAGWVELPGAVGAVENEWIIGACLVLVVIEFLADKVPVGDVAWNVLQTVVRVPVAGVLAYAATTPLDPQWQLLAGFLGSVIALVAHGGKVAAHSAVTPSPEPASNVALSLTEDAVAIGLTWFATQYPYLAAAIAIVLLVLIVMLIRFVVRTIWRMGKTAPADTPMSGVP
ncbi:MAG: DUF4126 domain-containing protein [Vicinamibacterales bacterium]